MLNFFSYVTRQDQEANNYVDQPKSYNHALISKDL